MSPSSETEEYSQVHGIIIECLRNIRQLFYSVAKNRRYSTCGGSRSGCTYLFNKRPLSIRLDHDDVRFRCVVLDSSHAAVEMLELYGYCVLCL
jgi:hypothetical protein